MSDIGKKTWLNAAGATMTHGQLARATFSGNPEQAPDGECAGVLEQRGYREINAKGDTYVDWFGSFTHVMLFCPTCQPELDDTAYVTTVDREPKSSDPFGDDAVVPATDLW